MAPRWSARRARSSVPRCTSSPTSTDLLFLPPLLRSLLQRRRARQDHLDARAAARHRIEIEPPPETVGDDAVDDVQAEPGAALIPAGCEERIEGPAPHVQRHAAT